MPKKMCLGGSIYININMLSEAVEELYCKNLHEGACDVV